MPIARIKPEDVKIAKMALAIAAHNLSKPYSGLPARNGQPAAVVKKTRDRLKVRIVEEAKDANFDCHKRADALNRAHLAAKLYAIATRK